MSPRRGSLHSPWTRCSRRICILLAEAFQVHTIQRANHVPAWMTPSHLNWRRAVVERFLSLDFLGSHCRPGIAFDGSPRQWSLCNKESYGRPFLLTGGNISYSMLLRSQMHILSIGYVHLWGLYWSYIYSDNEFSYYSLSKSRGLSSLRSRMILIASWR